MIKAFSAIVFGVTLALAPAAQAQDWPTRPVRFIVPFAPGSSPDLLARILAERLKKNLGQSFVVENKAGAGGMIGTDVIAKAEPDGYTIGVSIGGPLVNNTVLTKKMAYDPFRDIAPVTLAVNQPCVLVANLKFNGDTAAQMVDELKRNPETYNYASLGNGTMAHLAMAVIANRAGAKPTQIPYPGSGQAIAAIIAGDASLGCLPATAVIPQQQAGNVKVLGVASAKRYTLTPDVPTLGEQGLEGIVANSWIGVVAPAKTPPAILATLQGEVARILKEPDVTKALEVQFMEPVGSTPDEFRAYMKEELDRWAPIIKQNNITLD